MSHTYCLTKFAVLDDYREIKSEKGFFEKIFFSGDSDLLDAKFKSQKNYNPLEDAKELYMELNKINFKKPDSLLKFIATYGIPTGKEVLAGNTEVKAFVIMEAKEFIFKFLDLKKIIGIWKAIQDNDIDKLEETKKSFKLRTVGDQLEEYKAFEKFFSNKSEEELEEYHKNRIVTHNEFNLFTEVKNGDITDIAKAYITILLNKQSFGKIKTTIVDVPCTAKEKIVMKKKIVDAVSFQNLFEVAFYQLRQAIFNDMQVKTCEHCGFPFEVTHERQRFCPPLFGRKRSTCENTYNQRIKRQRRKEEQEKSVVTAPIKE